MAFCLSILLFFVAVMLFLRFGIPRFGVVINSPKRQLLGIGFLPFLSRLKAMNS